MTLLNPPQCSGFLDCPVVSDFAQASSDFAVVGVPFGVPYDLRDLVSDTVMAPEAIRKASHFYGAFRDHYDFDTDGPMLSCDIRLIDIGDIKIDPRDLPGSKANATKVIRDILDKGAVPIALGGDDSTPPIVIAAFEQKGPVTVVQIDAHIDYRDDVKGVKDGYSSPMRRAAEMPWVEKIVHVGIRSVGSARKEEVDATLAHGNAIVTAREIHQDGIQSALQHLPRGGNYYVTIDVDGFDPSFMPAPSVIAPGGLLYQHGMDLLIGLQEKGNIVGLGFAEYNASRDVNSITATGIMRLAIIAMASSRRP